MALQVDIIFYVTGENEDTTVIKDRDDWYELFGISCCHKCIFYIRLYLQI